MDMIFQVLILFSLGLIAGFINVMAGGGSSLTLPALIFLGLDPATANGTNRIGIMTQNIASVYSFKKENYFELKESMTLSLFALPGAIIGAIASVNIDDELFKNILGVVMIGIILSMILPGKKISVSTNLSKKEKYYLYASMVGVGFYGGFIQVGVGFLLMASLNYLGKLDLVRVNMHKVFVVFIYTIPALLIFILSGHVNWFLGLSLAAGNAIGGWWSAKFAVKKGEKIIKIILVTAILIMSLKLFNLF